MVKRRPGGYTYYGGNTNLSSLYKERYIPHYDPDTTMSNTDVTDRMPVLMKSQNWNTFQKRNWYQDNLDHVKPDLEEFPGLHAEWRQKGEFEKSYRKYNSKFVYDFRINVTSTDADGIDSTREIRTADHTAVTKLRRAVEESERYDVPERKTVAFDDLCSPIKNVESDTLGLNEPLNADSSNFDSQAFDTSVFSAKSETRNSLPRHPAINPGLCREHPRETFRVKKEYPLFWSKKQKADFQKKKSSGHLVDTSLNLSVPGDTRSKSAQLSSIILQSYPALSSSIRFSV